MKISLFRIKLIFLVFIISPLISQTTEDMKKFMDVYDKLKVNQEANNIVEKDIQNQNSDSEPIKILIEPKDINDYLNTKISTMKKEINKIQSYLSLDDSISKLNDFGYSFFASRDSVNYIDNIVIDENYILGFGDEIIFSVWGEVQQNEKKIIQRDGTIYIDNVGLLYLSGKTFQNAKKYILSRFSKVYSTLVTEPKLSFMDITIARLKKINIRVTGHVKYPGNYVVNPSISLTNLLIIAGGVNVSGSLRNITINRNSVPLDTIDFYPLISGEGLINDFGFLDKDIVIIPPKNNVISISGAVRNPGYFELKDDNLNELINYAGNFTHDAQKSLYIYRKNKSNLIINTLKSKDNFFENGDSIVIPTNWHKSKFMSITLDNTNSFKIPWLENITYQKLLSSINLSAIDIKQIELTRRIGNDSYQSFILENFENGFFEFLPNDHLVFHLKSDVRDLNTVVIKGFVKSPGKYPILGQTEKLESLINRAGGFLNNISMANVSVKRDTMKFGSSNGGLYLSPDDTVYVNSFVGTVEVIGEIHHPGNFQWDEYKYAKDYIKSAGGLTAYGDEDHIVYINPFSEAVKIKKSAKMYLLPGSKILVNQKPENELKLKPDRFQQVSSIISSLVSIAILANSTLRN